MYAEMERNVKYYLNNVIVNSRRLYHLKKIVLRQQILHSVRNIFLYKGFNREKYTVKIRKIHVKVMLAILVMQRTELASLQEGLEN
jgi:predicted RNA binding protein with dsRBD fold (UPF0201 family)